MAGDQSATYDDADAVLREALSVLDEHGAVVIDTGVEQHHVTDSADLWEGPEERPDIRVDGGGVHPKDVEAIHPPNPTTGEIDDAVADFEGAVEDLVSQHGAGAIYRAMQDVEGGVERSEGLTQGDNDGSVPCDLCDTPIPVHTPRIPVRDDGVVTQLCGACQSGLEDYFSVTESTEAEQSGGRTDA